MMFNIGGRPYPHGVYSSGAYQAGRNGDGTYDVYFDASTHGVTDGHWELIGTYLGEHGDGAVRAAIAAQRG